MARNKTLSPQEIYKARKQLEEDEKRAYLPPGLINHGNTCFMNSVLQGLIATKLLSDLALFAPLPEKLALASVPSISSRRSPQLTNGHGVGGVYQQGRVPGMPIGDVFVSILLHACAIRRTRRRECMSPRVLLMVMGEKHGQYMGFAQQDAHEFLRLLLDAMRMEELDIIKARRPKPSKKSRKRHRRSTVRAAPTPDSSVENKNATPSTSVDPDDTLVPFVDMVFGGKLSSVLVCETCKHVSQTEEDFYDLSLSIRPEDYTKERKRDRFRNFARRFAGFPSTGTSGSVETQRSSSVPPSPRDIKRVNEVQVEANPRRRSLDISTNANLDDIVVVEKSDAEGPGPPEGVEPASSDSKQLPTVEEEHHRVVGFAEPPKVGKKEKKEHDDASWSKLGRRLSMGIRLGRDRERKSLSREGTPSGTAEPTVVKPAEIGERSATQDSIASASNSDAGHHTDTSSEAHSLVETIPQSISNPETSKLAVRNRDSRPKSLPAVPPGMHSLVPLPIPRLPTIQHISSKRRSPQPPKPTPEEAEFLRQILADIPSSSSPFALFKSSGNRGNGNNGVSSSSSSANALWLKMGQLPGIEECLRMFTEVEMLEGENMVGCRRCWKIANGEYMATSPNEDEGSSESESESEDGEKFDEDSSYMGSDPLKDVTKLPSITTDSISPSNSPYTSLSASMSSPVISLNATKNRGGSFSVTSLPVLDTSADIPRPGSKPGNPFPSPGSSTGSSEPRTPNNGSSTPAWSTPPEMPSSPLTARPRSLGESDADHSEDATSPAVPPGLHAGVPIPSISTTAPESPISPLSARPKVDPEETHSHLTAPDLEHSLKTPRVLHRRPKESDFYDNSYESSETESDLSTSTSASEHSDASSPTVPSPNISPSQSQHSNESAKCLRSKQVILRSAYKRYLIGTPPPVLVIHLKRFQQISKTPMVPFSYGFKKLDDYVTFNEFLDLTPFLAPKKEDFGLGKEGKKAVRTKDKERCMYRLYAVVVHIGNMLGGHYVAYTALPSPPPVPTQTNDSSSTSTPNSETVPPATNAMKAPRQWAYISDTIVRLVSLEEVLKAKAYICMYERI